MSATLYRAFDADGELLYVGIAANPAQRFGGHQAQSPWWREVATLRLEHFELRDAALAAELEAIRTEHPRYNVNGSLRPLRADEPATPLRRVRIEKGLTLPQAARAINLPASALRHWELSGRTPTSKHVAAIPRLLELYGVEITDLWPIGEAAA